MNEFKAVKITDKVYWVGAIDNDIRDFHGYKITRGTTYNAYLILGEKPVLIDTVKAPFFEEMMERIRSVIDPKNIEYIISNHSEMDHSGCLLQAIKLIQPQKIFASKIGVQTLKEHFDFDVELTEVNTQENLTLGDANFKFFATQMLHWPDSMFTYFVNDGVLFSQDGFGMHLAPKKLFADKNDKEIMHCEAAKYFANILLPYSSFVTKLFAAFPGFNLDIKILAPDHGPIWRTQKDISWIMELWQQWALQKPGKKVVIVYDTMWNSTAKMAEAIAEGVACEDVVVKLMPLSTSHRSDVAKELLDAGALILGSPTLNRQMFPTVADLLCYLKGLRPQGLIGQVFGSYGWGGEAIKIMQEELSSINVQLVAEPVKTKYIPDKACLSNCKALGQNIAKMLIH